MIGYYIHVPFCLRKCYYCDFISYPYAGEKAAAYLQALAREAELYAGILPPEKRQAASVFVGGGTPTCLGEEDISKLLALGRRVFGWAQAPEITVEANPGTLTPGKLAALREGGANRLSLGVQAFQDRLLTGIGRIHRVREVYRSVEMVRRAGFANLNLDLIFALPGQTREDWQETLREAVALAPEHLAVYSLKIEEATPFGYRKAKGLLASADEELELAMYREAMDFLTHHGYEHYEISNFARPGYQSRHNLIYWNNEEYLGLGPGAWSYLEHRRFANYRDLFRYQEALSQGRFPVEEEEHLTKEIEMSETVFMALRQLAGLDLNSFVQRFGVRAEEIFATPIEKLLKLKMLEMVNNRLRLTPLGLPIANEIFAHFLL